MSYSPAVGSLAIFAAQAAPLDLPIWSVIPFAALLLCIAVLPLTFGKFWHDDRNKAIVAAAFSLPVVVYLAYLRLTTGQQTLYPLAHELGKYASFIVMLGSLYVVAGGIVIRGKWRPTPFANAVLLLFGALIANVIGTTGASVLLIRPLLRMNADRPAKMHLPIFFIFLVSNLGGCLTPLGDPPLFMGYLNGVPFTWTFTLWPEYFVVVGCVLGVFTIWDAVAGPAKVVGDVAYEPIRVEGRVNLLLLLGIMAAVLIESDWLPMWDLFGGELLMLIMAGLSWRFTPTALRQANRFSWEPIREVAILFAGIFVTMVPALQLLEKHGAGLGLSQSWHYFWCTGLLSSSLDNAPTYLAFATVAAGSNDFAVLVAQQPAILRAISCGAVFMGALTYIGNGPNFMIKAIAEREGYQPPSFFGYMAYSFAILIPIFLLVTLLFFRPA